MAERDDDVVARAKTGDPDAWRTLHRAHAGRLVAWLSTRPSGDSMVAPEDVASEAWLVAASKVADFEGTSSEFAGWLFGIARKIGGSTRRRSDRRRTDPSDPQDAGAQLPAVPDPVLALAGQDWVRHAIASLPPRERDAVGLVDGLGFDNHGAAAALGISAVAVRVARHRGLRRLRGRLAGAGGQSARAGSEVPRG
ncbi:RNA polymerase sigma factor [Nocardioides sp. W7]|uniref:RNA polymerase sigma factor n=1 Tax=Nocardioides sp. W7 TaxID=2931390 RepID=UPI001FD28B3E|nr:RNA polymerase sigma factor [Nocardioides sp. W7]